MTLGISTTARRLSLPGFPSTAKPRRVLLHAPKNGFFYVLDARTGKLLQAEKLVDVNWATRIDMKTGRPVEVPNFRTTSLPTKASW